MLYCGKCGTENPDGQRFCGSCGAALTSGTSTSADVTAATIEARNKPFWRNGWFLLPVVVGLFLAGVYGLEPIASVVYSVMPRCTISIGDKSSPMIEQIRGLSSDGICRRARTTPNSTVVDDHATDGLMVVCTFYQNEARMQLYTKDAMGSDATATLCTAFQHGFTD